MVQVQEKPGVYSSFKIMAYKPGEGSQDTVSSNVINGNSWDYASTVKYMKLLDQLQVKAQDMNKTLIFFDIGANIGWFTFTTASKGIKVKAFEPFKSNYDAIKVAKCLNS